MDVLWIRLPAPDVEQERVKPIFRIGVKILLTLTTIYDGSGWVHIWLQHIFPYFIVGSVKLVERGDTKLYMLLLEIVTCWKENYIFLIFRQFFQGIIREKSFDTAANRLWIFTFAWSLALILSFCPWLTLSSPSCLQTIQHGSIANNRQTDI